MCETTVTATTRLQNTIQSIVQMYWTTLQATRFAYKFTYHATPPLALVTNGLSLIIFARMYRAKQQVYAGVYCQVCKRKTENAAIITVGLHCCDCLRCRRLVAFSQRHAIFRFVCIGARDTEQDAMTMMLMMMMMMTQRSVEPTPL